MDAKSPILVFMLAACVCLTAISAHSDRDSGCNENTLEERASKCENDFFKAMINGGDCSKLYINFVTCMKTAIVSCYSKLPEETTRILVDAAMGLVKAQQFYCSDTVLNINLTAVPDAVKKAVSCKDAYFGEGATCANDFRKKFTTNATNPELCSEYKKVQECDDKAAKTHCSGAVSIKEKRNAFCPTTSATTRAAAQPLMLVYTALLLISAML